MAKIDFITAFGRLLRDASLRHAYATDPIGTADSLGLPIESRKAWLDLDQADLELQAEVLLRKRFQVVSRLIPQTIANLGGRSWPLFADYARKDWPTGEAAALHDAHRFCSGLDSFVQTDERNRLRFAMGNSLFAIHFVSDALIRHRRRRCLQLLVRTQGRAWREWCLYLG